MRGRMADDMMEAVNLTHRVERAVLEQRLEDAEQNMAIRDLRLDWMSFKALYGADDETDHVADPASRPDRGQYHSRSDQASPVVVGQFVRGAFKKFVDRYRLTLQILLILCDWLVPSVSTTASEVTTLWRYRNECIIIILSLIHI